MLRDLGGVHGLFFNGSVKGFVEAFGIEVF